MIKIKSFEDIDKLEKVLKEKYKTAFLIDMIDYKVFSFDDIRTKLKNETEKSMIVDRAYKIFVADKGLKELNIKVVIVNELLMF